MSSVESSLRSSSERKRGQDDESHRAAVRLLAARIGEDRVSSDPIELARLASNTLGVERTLLAVARPENTQQVQSVVEVCSALGLGVYPVSRGRNVGYGEMAPVTDGQILVDLSGMNRIRSFDSESGKVIVEPGVTQQQLYDFLRKMQAGFWMDATGSGTLSSVLGNALEGGFGHTPVGDRRRLLAGLEVVLGNSEVLHAGSFPDVGPDLNGLFVQSNFGIVTAMEVTLFPAPECYESFLLRVKSEDDLEPLIDALAALRRDGTLTSLVHVANATRTLVSGARLPDSFKGRKITNRDAVEFLNTPFAKAGHWSAIGGIYGSRRMVAARRKDLKRALRGIAGVQFVTDRKLRWLQWLVEHRVFGDLAIADKARLVFEVASYVHGLGKGVPSDHGMDGEMRRTEEFEKPGLFWCSPTFAADGETARAVVETGERLFDRYGFELPVTITFVSPGRVIATMSCCFDDADAEQRKRAHDLFSDLHRELGNDGISFYREGILGMSDIRHRDRGKTRALSRLKLHLDPRRIVSPGRYGID